MISIILSIKQEKLSRAKKQSHLFKASWVIQSLLMRLRAIFILTFFD